MQFVQPIPFEEAIRKLGSRSFIGSKLSSSEWSDVPVQVRERAFFSSQVESVKFLQRGSDSIRDFLAANLEGGGDFKIALRNGEMVNAPLKIGSRADFVSQMQEFLAREGVERTSGGLTDITSERRQGLIFDVQTQQCQDFGYRKQGLDPDVLNEFPAQRFIRVKDVKDPRDDHAQYENQVWLKTDPIWSRVINKDFGVAYGPWGWGCGHDVEDVDRDEAESLGLVQRGEKLSAPTENLNDNLGASVAGLEPELVDKLKDAFGDQMIIEDGRMRWRTN